MLPLEDIKVLDLSRLAPGPFCTMVLGDLGADILRVEQPRGEPQEGTRERREAAFDAQRRNKESICLNLKQEEGRRIFYKLAKTMDVLVEEFRPGVVKRLGVDYESINKINPRIVYCSISGYGQQGPYSNLPGHDVNYISVAGALSLIGSRDGPPVIPYNFIADYAGGGLLAAVGILAALMARARTGKGQYIDISMMDGVVYLMASVFSRYFAYGEIPGRGRHWINGGHPYYKVYQCLDGKYLSVGCWERHFYENLCTALGREEFIPDQFNEDMRPMIEATFAEIFKTRTRDEWWDYLRQREICVAPVNTLDEVFRDPQVLHRGMKSAVGQFDGETVYQVGIGPKLSHTPGSVRRLGSVSGKDTDSVLIQLGYTGEQIARLRQEGAVE